MGQILWGYFKILTLDEVSLCFKLNQMMLTSKKKRKKNRTAPGILNEVFQTSILVSVQYSWPTSFLLLSVAYIIEKRLVS